MSFTYRVSFKFLPCLVYVESHFHMPIKTQLRMCAVLFEPQPFALYTGLCVKCYCANSFAI